MAVEELTTIQSGFAPEATLKRLEAELTARGLAIFARFDHAAGAAAAGLPLRPTTVVVFGQAKGGTPLMQAAQTIGIDLPLKALDWQDDEGRTWLSYNEPDWLARRHGLDGPAEPAVAALSSALRAIAQAVTTGPA